MLGGRYCRRPVWILLEGQGWGGVAQKIVRDAPCADCLLCQPTFEGAPQRRSAVRLQEIVQQLDIMNPQLWAPMGESVK